MTTDNPNPPEEIGSNQAQDLSGTETKLALDDFSNAMGDADIGVSAGDTAADPAENASADKSGLEALYDIPVNITIVLGRTQIEVSDLLALNKGDVVELDRKVGEAIDIFVNNRLVARGEVVLVDNRLGITMTEIIKNAQAS